MIYRIPKMYEEMPFPEGYFEIDPQKQGKNSDIIYDYNAIYHYAKERNVPIYELSAAEMWMFRMNSDHEYVNNHYQHYLETGEVLPYDGPKRTKRDDEMLANWRKDFADSTYSKLKVDDIL